jgi:hypothetical protein
MIITSKFSVINLVYSNTLVVTFDAQETRFAKAYGEPRIDVAGVIPYDAGEPAPPVNLAFTIEEDIGAPLVGGAAAFNNASANWEISAVGDTTLTPGTVVGFHKGFEEVLGNVLLATQIDYVAGNVDEGVGDDYLIGFCVLPGTDAADDLAGLFFGWGQYNSVRRIFAFEKTKGGAGVLIGAPVARPSPNGLYLRMTREADAYTFEYSLNNAQTWAVLGSTTLGSAAPRLGLFVSSGDDLTPATALFSNLAATTLPVPTPGTFTILGSPDMRLMRSQGPHTFQLDGKVDPQAKEKVEGWSAEISARLSAAKATLLANPDPGPNPAESIAQA